MGFGLKTHDEYGSVPLGKKLIKTGYDGDWPLTVGLQFKYETLTTTTYAVHRGF